LQIDISFTFYVYFILILITSGPTIWQEAAPTRVFRSWSPDFVEELA